MAAKLSWLVVAALGLSAIADNQPAMMQISPLAEKDLQAAFDEAISDEQKEEPKMPQSLAAVSTHLRALPARLASSKVGASNETVTDFEKDVTDLVLGLSAAGLQATPFGKSVQKIINVIQKEMMPAVNGAHKANQLELNKLAKALEKCGKTKDTALATALKTKKKYEATSPKHKTCRVGEAGLYTENVDCHKEWKERKKIKELKCKHYSTTTKRTGDQNANKNIVSKGGSESVETYVKRITRTICGKPTGGGGKGGSRRRSGNGGAGEGGLLDDLLDAKDACEKATKRFNDQTKKCNKLDKQWHNKRKQCNSLQDTMDDKSCKYAIDKKDACEAYAECYAARRGAYERAEKTVRKEEIDRKAEWKGLKRMNCIITAFKDGKVEQKEINVCKARTHSTNHLNIKYPKLPSLVKCVVPKLYPTTDEYKKKEFTPLPILAKGKFQANECTGVAAVSTKPAVGSPASCKCRRVTMNGPYKPGPVVKCNGCTDVRRTSDKISCPVGTKLFSPRSRLDWDSFIKSTKPLRAPNWIIDVTRPQNGCGGCTRYSMNSQTAQQKTWTTQDGTAWWLRSTRYNEPNGDYHANCYLDLWQNPKNGNSVTWNDGSCSYHAKSYYCQMIAIGTKCKPGSPGACKCDKVKLNGKYSASTLLRCSNGLTARRSNDKNSCPAGTKLFSPASRADWKTFIKSASSLRNPHWIIDVTRPQNGCGGCTGNPMNSANAAQATWRTADASPWWLRSSRYNEPNGDYHANCYLDLWQKPANENSVTWNDGSCSYHARSYYCQTAKPKKVKKVVKTTKPPWKRSKCSTKPNKGSPGGCKCQKLTLKGAYASGCVLKCTGCLRIRKKSEKNSCPLNTKLWSPESRSDWKTFLASGGKPLRSPHWIIDVTRPQNGCGGCTGNAMNSANSKQSTWRTSDGSPWWLRSRTYNEPNGDYTANCYLDLWKTPANENSVTWNDGRCNYHSNAYYCQPKKGTR